jgi:N-acetylated-alpha-linked acidic dipeptidase
MTARARGVRGHEPASWARRRRSILGLPIVVAAALPTAPPTAAAPTALLPASQDPTTRAAQAGSEARALLAELCATTRLAGTAPSRRAAELVRDELEAAGFEVEWDEREVLLSLPRRTRLVLHAGPGEGAPLVERLRSFDADAVPPGDLPPFHAWSASASARGPVVDCGWGLREDFERLLAAGIDLRGCVALCRYGRSYRGVKAENAQRFGCSAVLMFTDPAEAGPERGPVWPEGPWMPGWAVQRGSIAPMAQSPGDPSTPGTPSPAPGAEAKRLDAEALADLLPRIPSLPIGADDARVLLEGIESLGPGPAEVTLEIDAPRTLRTIVSVLGHLPGTRPGFVLAGNHRDSWVRGANDAGGGTVSLLVAARALGRRAAEGWRPRHGISVAFWDAEESGLIGSTEWGEAHAERLREELLLYVNADALVGGLEFGCSGTPGLEAMVAEALAEVPHPAGRSVAARWLGGKGGRPELALPGSGSDYTVFLHHLGIPILDLGFGGNGGGQYHTVFDDFALIDRFLDPGFRAHGLAAVSLEALLATAADQGPLGLDEAAFARSLAQHAARTADWLGAERAERLAQSFERLATAHEARWRRWSEAMDLGVEPVEGPFGTYPSLRAAIRRAGGAARADAERLVDRATALRALERPDGLPERPWFTNRLWAPDPERGYGSHTFPSLREPGEGRTVDEELASLLGALEELCAELEGSTPR